MKDEVPEGPTAAGQQELKERVIKKKKKERGRIEGRRGEGITTREMKKNGGDEESGAG
jgi:hypothetical protein